MPKPNRVTREKPADAARACVDDAPYRMLVYVKNSPHGVPLYQVAGSSAAPTGAEKALRRAFRIHGGSCFYCKEKVCDLAIDHAEPVKGGGTGSIQNLLICCKPCNTHKGHRPIEAWHPGAGREWLQALLKQVQERLDKLEP